MGDVFELAKVRLVIEQPFFAVLALHLIEKKITSEIEKLLVLPTCGTDGRYLYVNEDWVSKLPLEEQKGLLAHEVMHPALGHVFDWRRGGRNPHRWNVAGDHVINLLLKEAGMKLPPGGCCDEKYAGMSTEQVYDLLPASTEKKGGVSIDVISPGSGGTKKGSGDDKDGKGGQGEGVKPLSPQQQAQLEQEFKELLQSAAALAKMRGKLPAGIERMVDKLTKPRIPWYQILEQFVSETVKDDYDMLTPDRRMLQLGIYLPDLNGEGTSVAVGIDTSGSIGKKDLHEFLSETAGILFSRRVTSMRLLACDAEVSLDKTLSPWDTLPSELGGGGGTDFRPVFDRINKDPRAPACCVFFTDLCGSFPRRHPHYPVVWVTKEDGIMPPFGHVIVYDPTDRRVVKVKHAKGKDYQDE